MNCKELRLCLITTLFCFLFSCNQGKRNVSLVEYQGGRQLLTLNDKTIEGKVLIQPKIKLIAPDTIHLNEKFKAKIFLSSNRYKLIAAYFDCQEVPTPTVDTVLNTKNDYRRLDGCKKGLFVVNDTVFVEFKPNSLGNKEFDEITILTIDEHKIFRTQDYTLEYFVPE